MIRRAMRSNRYAPRGDFDRGRRNWFPRELTFADGFGNALFDLAE